MAARISCSKARHAVRYHSRHIHDKYCSSQEFGKYLSTSLSWTLLSRGSRHLLSVAANISWETNSRRFNSPLFIERCLTRLPGSSIAIRRLLGPENSLNPLFCLPVHQDPSIWSSAQTVSDPGQPKAPEDHPVLSLILQLLAEVYFSHLAR